MADGTVTWFDQRRRFGFISRAGFVSRDGGGADVFVHGSQINADSRALTQGDHVRFTLELGSKGVHATDVRVVRSF